MTEKFFISEEKKVIVCVLENVCEDCESHNSLCSCSCDGEEYKGKTKCSDLDKFDIFTGKRIASLRAWKKFHEANLKNSKNILRELDKVEKTVMAKLNKAETKIANIDAALERFN